jgi:hypothetical protein
VLSCVKNFGFSEWVSVLFFGFLGFKSYGLVVGISLGVYIGGSPCTLVFFFLSSLRNAFLLPVTFSTIILFFFVMRFLSCSPLV